MFEKLVTAKLVCDASGVPVSEMYGDVYHSAAGGHDQARQVFLAGNGLPERWRGYERFTILETGFGLGLNFMATVLAWQNDPQACQVLSYVALEKHPFKHEDLIQAHAKWPEFEAISGVLHALWPAPRAGYSLLPLEGGRVLLTLVQGDVLDYLPTLECCADAFYLDGFSPTRNPDMWSPAVARSLAGLAVPGATLATWSVAGSVRRVLSEAGFTVQKAPGFGGKRQMLRGVFSSREPGPAA